VFRLANDDLQSSTVNGLRFTCQRGCTKCCDTRGFVYMTEDDLERAASFLGISPAEFETNYVVRYRRVLRLRKPPDSQCHFLNSDGCRIHPAKPTQCRTYPFWPELVGSRDAWGAEAKRCPGIGIGELVQIGTACETAGEMKQAFPFFYSDTEGR
jgi:Fe-S-cluster containining protein